MILGKSSYLGIKLQESYGGEGNQIVSWPLSGMAFGSKYFIPPSLQEKGLRSKK
jgi:hypothetical protein